MAWVGGSIASQFFAIRLKTAEPAHRLGFARDLRFTGLWLFSPAAIVLLAAGVWMVLEYDQFAFEDTWIVIGIGAVAIGLGTAIGYLLPNVKKAIDLMTSGRGPEAGAIIARVSIAARLLIVVFLIAVWAMVVQPGG